MSDNVIQLHPDLPEDYCIGLDDLDNQDEVRKMLEFLDMQVVEALSTVSGDINPVNGYVRARSILQCACDQVPMEETQKNPGCLFSPDSKFQGTGSGPDY